MSTNRTFAANWAATSDNRAAIDRVLSGTDLPHPSVLPLPDGVLVTVGDVDDLDAWHHELGGAVSVGPEFHGFRLWVLRTEIERAAGPLVAWVSASVPVRAAVMPELDAAARAGLAVA